MLDDLRKAANVEIARLVHSQDNVFYARTHCHRAFGLWAASLLNYQTRAWDFANYIVELGLSEPDDYQLAKLIKKELERRGLKLSEAEVRSELDRQARLADPEHQPGGLRR